MGDLVLVQNRPITGRSGDHEAEDASLVAMARHERAAFAPLYVHYVDPVYRVCLRRLGSKEAAEDATAQVFVKVLAALPSYREESGSFRSWLFAITHNVLVDVERHRRPVDSLDLAAELTDPTGGPEAAALAEESKQEVRAFLMAVAPDQRRVLELRLAGLTTAEIARALDRSPGAVRATQFRAVARLRSFLGLTKDREGPADA